MNMLILDTMMEVGWTSGTRFYYKRITHVSGYYYRIYMVLSSGDKEIIYQRTFGNSVTNSNYYIKFGTLDFGETEQFVSDDFYKWLSKWASPYDCVISGVYTLNMSLSELRPNYNIYEAVDFISNNEKFNILTIDTNDSYYYKSETSSKKAFQINYNYVTWYNMNYRVIEVVGEQKVTQRFYDWLMLNTIENGLTLEPTIFDLSTLGLSAGTHAITVKAYASGYDDSEESTAVNYTVEWVSSEGIAYTLSDDGTYYICSDIGTCTNTDIVIASEYKGLPVKGIDKRAFLNCNNLTSIIIGGSVTSIGYEAFYGCENITSVVIGNSVTSIGERAFYACERLTSVVIPDSVTIINNGTFNYCRSLTSVVIPDGVTSIGKKAFSGCDSLTELRFNGTIEQWKSIVTGEEWDYNVPAIYIQCTDGTIVI